jgi:site-specific DNA-methyltransferase (adenine-specific)
MTDFKNTPELSESTEPAISYSTCYQQCFLSDNLDLMKTIESNTIDLIYCDILYGTGRKFKDYQDLKPNRIEIENHYIPRLKEMHRILKPTGSIYLQMDTKINHWIRCIMDDIFGYERMLNEIIWCYRSQGFNKNKWSEKHDVILLYSKSKEWTFNLEAVRENEIGESTQKRWHKEIKEHGLIPTTKNGKVYWNSPYSPPRDWINMNALPQAHSERNGYDTQKPKELIAKFIKASSNEGDLVADFYAGSFTTAEVCKDLNRNFIGCDINPFALEISKQRLA